MTVQKNKAVRPFFPTNSRIRFPSGQGGIFIRWRGRAVTPGDVAAGLENIAVVRLDGADSDTDFSERFMQQVQICR